MKKLALWIAVVGLSFSLWGCKKGSVEGTYTLDKAAMKAEIEAKIAKMPKEKQGFAKFGLAIIDMMNVSLSLEAGGKATMNSTTPNPFKKGEVRKKSEVGTWKMDGGKIAITTTNAKTKKEQTVRCDFSGKKLTCTGKGRRGKDRTMSFIKG
ncbi:MAG: hypothetical protein H6728_01330 [Myxococcales bacterium]|nr:hypothetical protein [Myxococcales bacterium]MCB9641695.1 hypothetical protein [Myxococcales bacterium]